MKTAILGFGREGKSVFKFLREKLRIKKSEITILDKKFGQHYLKNLDRSSIIFRSPGVPYNLPELRRARGRGVVFSSATKLFFRHCPGKIIGVTGTKGKGTTSTLIYKILRSAGREAFLVGNIGTPALEILPKLKRSSFVVFELSSFQLHDLGQSPPLAVLLDIFPDHLDAHLNLAEYYSAKTPIARFQKRGDKIFFFKNNRASKRIASLSAGRKIGVDENHFALFTPKDLKIKGAHNFKNAAMAATIASHLGVPKKTIVKVIKNFRGLEHRLEFIRRISRNRRQSASIEFYNDSASTNPHTAAAAVKASRNTPNILIAGGHDKGLNYQPLAAALKNSETKLVILLGENKKKMRKALAATKVPVKLTSTLREAVSLAYHTARLLSARTINIIFSPGAASFDMFKNYADRGRQFKKLVKNLQTR